MTIAEQIDRARRQYALSYTDSMPVAVAISEDQLTELDGNKLARQRLGTSDDPLEKGMRIYGGLKLLIWRVPAVGPAVMGRELAYKLADAGLAFFA